MICNYMYNDKWFLTALNEIRFFGIYLKGEKMQWDETLPSIYVLFDNIF